MYSALLRTSRYWPDYRRVPKLLQQKRLKRQVIRVSGSSHRSVPLSHRYCSTARTVTCVSSCSWTTQPVLTTATKTITKPSSSVRWSCVSKKPNCSVMTILLIISWRTAWRRIIRPWMRSWLLFGHRLWRLLSVKLRLCRNCWSKICRVRNCNPGTGGIMQRNCVKPNMRWTRKN